MHENDKWCGVDLIPKDLCVDFFAYVSLSSFGFQGLESATSMIWHVTPPSVRDVNLFEVR